MKTAEAIKWFEKHKARIMTISEREMYDKAITALRAQLERENPMHKELSVEVVPVVRCLKCRHARKLTFSEGIRFTSDCAVCMHPYGAGVSYPEYSMDGRVVWKSDYCSYGEPKPDGGADDA